MSFKACGSLVDFLSDDLSIDERAVKVPAYCTTVNVFFLLWLLIFALDIEVVLCSGTYSHIPSWIDPYHYVPSFFAFCNRLYF